MKKKNEIIDSLINKILINNSYCNICLGMNSLIGWFILFLLIFLILSHSFEFDFYYLKKIIWKNIDLLKN